MKPAGWAYMEVQGGDLGETFRRYYENKWGRD
nr:MAG TPA: hypothetical protein [Caudoviricetes sp.]